MGRCGAALVLVGMAVVACGEPTEPPATEAPVQSPTPPPPAGPTPPTKERTTEILTDLRRWDDAADHERRAAAERVEKLFDDFEMLRIATFSGGGQTHQIGVFIHRKTRGEFSLIPGGSFEMGSPPGDDPGGRFERPRRTVTIRRPFLIARTECTQEAWRVAGGGNGSIGEGDALPITMVSWSEVVAWCGGVGLRLPSEAEWEYSCRAGTTTHFWSGQYDVDLAQVGWFEGTKTGAPRPCGEKPPNAFGLHDVHGNVWEWCADWWHDSYEEAPIDGTPWTEPATERRVVRGGSWRNRAWMARSAFRATSDPETGAVVIGFRPVKNIKLD